MREKTLLKRRINKEHNSNFRAGYVQIHEEHLHKTGIRGRKQYVVYGLMIIIFVLAVLNLLVSDSLSDENISFHMFHSLLTELLSLTKTFLKNFAFTVLANQLNQLCHIPTL